MTEKERPRYPEPPTTWEKSPVQKPKRSWRGFFIGMLVMLVLVLAIPLLLYVAALVYIHTGGVERAVKAGVAESLGPDATVASVDMSGIESLRIDELTVPSADGNATPAVQVQAVKVLWDPYALVMQKQIRAVEVTKPSLALRRDADGKWNFELRPSEPSGVWVEQIQVTGGTLGLEWAPERRVDLSGVRVFMTRARPPLPQPITVYAQLPSKSEVRADAILGPGAAMAGSLGGTLELPGDLATVGWPGEPPTGKVAFRLDARREWSVYSGTAGDLSFDGRVNLKDFRYTLKKGLALTAPERRIELRARVTSPGEHTIASVEDVVLDIEGLGLLRGRVSLPTAEGGPVVFEKGQLKVTIGSVPQWFEGLSFLPDWEKDGDVVLQDVTVTVPLDDPGALTYRGRVTLPELKLGIPKAGRLPPLQLQADVSGSLKGAKIVGAEAKFGNVGQVTFGAEANWTDLNGAWLELLKAVNLRSFDLDVGALLRTEVVRRLVTGRLGEGDVPAVREMPFMAHGRLSARDLKATAKVEGNTTTVSLSGVQATDLEVRRAPIPVRLEGVKLNGVLNGEVRAVGTEPRAVRLNGEIASSAEPPLTATFAVRMDADQDGKLGLSGADVPLLKVPVEGLLRLFGLGDYVKCSGDLTLTDATYDAVDRSAAGLLGFQKLKAYATGLALEDFTGQARVTFKDGRITAKGRIEPAQVVILASRTQVPAMEWTVSAAMDRDGVWREFAVNLGWENGEHFAVSAVLSQPAPGAWRSLGRIETSFWGGLKGGYDVTLDTAGFPSSEWVQWKLGPAVLRLEDFDLARLAETPLGSFVPTALKLAGKLPSLNLESSPFSLAELRTGRPGSNVVVRGEFSNVHVVYSPSSNELDRSEADRLSGTFRGEVTFDAGSAGFTCNLLTTLKDYEMLLDPRYVVFLGSFKPNERFYIPPPKAKEKLTAQFVGQIQTQKGGTMDVRLHKLLFDMERRLRLSATGRLTVPSDWDLFEKGEGLISELEVSSADLEALNLELLQRNIGQRVPDLKLSGSFMYKGRHVWSTDRSALSGSLTFRNVNAANVGWAVEALNGSLPLAFHQGLWPGDWPRELRGTMTVGSVSRNPLKIPKQPLAIVATPNEIALANPVRATVPGGDVQLEGLRIQNILTGAPNIDFGFRVNGLSFANLAGEQKLTFNGLQGYGQQPPAVLTGLLSPCRLWREPSVLGTWDLITNGSLTAPIFEGQLTVTGLYGRDCLGLTPVLGLREARIEGLSIGSLTALNPVHGHVKVDVDIKLSDFEMQGLDVSGVRRFRMEVRSIPKPDKEYFFERRFAQWLSKEPEEKVSVGKKPLFQYLGWGMELTPVSGTDRQADSSLRADDAWLYYMLPLLPNECILSGIRLEGVENSAVSDEKRQVKGKANERILWRDVLAKWFK